MRLRLRRCTGALVWTLATAGLLGSGCSRSETQGAAPTGREAQPASRVCPGHVRIDLAYPGASAAEVEASVALPVEEVVARVHGVERVDVTIAEGRARLWVETPLPRLADTSLELTEALGKLTTLPAEVEAPVVLTDSPCGARLVIISRGPPEPLTSSVDQLTRALSSTPGVRSVEQRGRPSMVLSIELDHARLSALGLDVAAVASTLARTLRPTLDLEGLRRTELAAAGATRVTLADVAQLRLGPDPDGPRAWSREGAAQILLVDADDSSNLERALAETPEIPGVHHAVAGRIVPRGCCAPAIGPELDGDFDLLELVLSPGTESLDGIVRQAPAGDAVWLVADPLLGASPTRTQLLIASDSPGRVELLQWLERTPGLQVLRHRGPRQGEVVVELRHADEDVMREGAAWLVARAREQGWHASAGPPGHPQIDVRLQHEAAARLGMSAGDVQAQLRLATVGRVLGRIDDGARGLVVRIQPVHGASADDADPTRLALIPLQTPSGAVVPLSAVAELRTTTEPAPRMRRDSQRVHYVHLSVERARLREARRAVDEQLVPALRRAHPELDARREPGSDE